MAQRVKQYRNITLTQGGADAFVQATEFTGIDPSQGQGWLIDRVEVQFAQAAALQGVSADFSVHWSLNRESETAVMDLAEGQCIMASGFFGSLTTSGQVIIPSVWSWQAPEGVIIADPSLYAQLDSAATGLTLTAYMRVYFETVKLTELEVLRMLTQG